MTSMSIITNTSREVGLIGWKGDVVILIRNTQSRATEYARLTADELDEYIAMLWIARREMTNHIVDPSMT